MAPNRRFLRVFLSSHSRLARNRRSVPQNDPANKTTKRVWTHREEIKLLKAMKRFGIKGEKGEVGDVSGFCEHMKKALRDSSVTQAQLYKKMGKLRKWYYRRLLAEVSEDDFCKELLRRKMCGERSSELAKELENILETENELKLRFSELTKEAENLLASQIEVKLRRVALSREVRAASCVPRAA